MVIGSLVEGERETASAKTAKPILDNDKISQEDQAIKVLFCLSPSEEKETRS